MSAGRPAASRTRSSSGRAMRAAPCTGPAGRGSMNQHASHTKPSAPVRMKAIFHPHASAITGTSSGVATAPMFGARFMIPSASERSSPRNHVATVFTAAGRLIASNAASATRVVKKPVTVVTSTCVICGDAPPADADGVSRPQPDAVDEPSHRQHRADGRKLESGIDVGVVANRSSRTALRAAA